MHSTHQIPTKNFFQAHKSASYILLRKLIFLICLEKSITWSASYAYSKSKPIPVHSSQKKSIIKRNFLRSFERTDKLTCLKCFIFT